MSENRRAHKFNRLTAKQKDTIVWLSRHGYDPIDIEERFSISRQELYQIRHEARGSGCDSSRGNGLGPRSSLAERGRDPARMEHERID